ncbi:MAG: 23S rRNA (adenine(2503)-C(2))-methyltransferase RlmN [Rickettsiales bacterium]|jgi:23S rRNA (adenine2503-C2)-methyltransferase|nr:23S rRNA (adenine(2503)-C(2))-methyltransferase RlmN [Rickettsiales bacterium]
MKNIFDFTLDELRRELEAEFFAKSFVANQIWNWLYCKGVKSFGDMVNISKELRAKLTEKYSIGRPAAIKDLISSDKTRKWLLELGDGEKIETAHIPEEDRGTLCISSQAGCGMGCKFCGTGACGLTRNLDAGEIVSQVIAARDYLGEWDNLAKGIGDGRKITNIVVMGMGEPLNNYDNTLRALKIINDANGIAFSNRRITLSTCGIVPRIYDLARDIKINLAISLHATTDEARKKIMPIAERFTLAELMTACACYAKNTNYRRITFEYIMLKNVNDSPDDARRLVSLVKKYNMPAKFNLIPFNYWDGCIFKEPSKKKTILEFAKYITNAGYPCPVRFSRGGDISAACGQLRGAASQRCGEKARAGDIINTF